MLWVPPAAAGRSVVGGQEGLLCEAMGTFHWYLCYLLGGAAGDFLSLFFQPGSLFCAL